MFFFFFFSGSNRVFILALVYFKHVYRSQNSTQKGINTTIEKNKSKKFQLYFTKSMDFSVREGDIIIAVIRVLPLSSPRKH